MIDLNEMARLIISRTAGWPGDEAYIVSQLERVRCDIAVEWCANAYIQVHLTESRVAFLEKHCQDLLNQREAAIDGEVRARIERDKAQAALREKAW